MLIAGAGVVGCAIARELSLFDLRVTLCEAGPDVGAGTSKANTALLHTGFDAKPGTLESRLVVRGYRLLGDYAARVGIPVEHTGALLVAWNEEQVASFPSIVSASVANGYDAIRSLDAEELYRREPSLGQGALGALEVPDEAIICPFTTPLAFATEAVLNGCTLLRLAPLSEASRLEGGGFLARVGDRSLRTRFLVNAAGLRSDEIDRMLGHSGFTVTPRRGELIVFDKLSRPLVSHVVLAVPTKVTKGVLIAPTVFGNVMLGPTAEDVERKDDTSATADGLAYLLRRGRAHHADVVGARGHGGVRGAARGDRARGLPGVDARGLRLRLRGRDPLDGTVVVDGARRARACGAGGGRAAARAAFRRACFGADAEHRRGGAAAVR